MKRQVIRGFCEGVVFYIVHRQAAKRLEQTNVLARLLEWMPSRVRGDLTKKYSKVIGKRITNLENGSFQYLT